jgi:purine-binding chemotaxis protein CheW
MKRACLTFRVGHEWYGLPVGAIVQVLHMLALNEIPDSHILGVMTLRDRVLPVIDLRHRFGIASPVFELDTPIIAVHTEHTTTGLVVDEVDDVAHFTETDVSSYSTNFIEGVFRLEGRTVFLINLLRLLVDAAPVSDKPFTSDEMVPGQSNSLTG